MKDLIAENQQLKLEIANLKRQLHPNKAPLDEIAQAVSIATHITLDDMRGRCRVRENVVARQMFFYIARRSGFSWNKLGIYLSRDHSTAIHGYRQMQDYLSLPHYKFENEAFLFASQILAARHA